jgi:hypothetical protein
LRFIACHERPSGERYGDNGGARLAIRKVMEDRVGSWRRAEASPASIEDSRISAFFGMPFAGK